MTEPITGVSIHCPLEAATERHFTSKQHHDAGRNSAQIKGLATWAVAILLARRFVLDNEYKGHVKDADLAGEADCHGFVSFTEVDAVVLSISDQGQGKGDAG